MSEPTVEQLANFACVRIQTIMGAPPSARFVRAMLEASPALQENWRKQHAEFQRQADELAASICEWCEGAGNVEVDGAEESCLRCRGTGRTDAA